MSCFCTKCQNVENRERCGVGRAVAIVHSELGLGLSQRKIQRLISKSRITDLRNGGQHSYVSARRLFWVIRELQAVANARTAGGTF